MMELSPLDKNWITKLCNDLLQRASAKAPKQNDPGSYWSSNLEMFYWLFCSCLWILWGIIWGNASNISTDLSLSWQKQICELRGTEIKCNTAFITSAVLRESRFLLT